MVIFIFVRSRKFYISFSLVSFLLKPALTLDQPKVRLVYEYENTGYSFMCFVEHLTEKAFLGKALLLRVLLMNTIVSGFKH